MKSAVSSLSPCLIALLSVVFASGAAAQDGAGAGTRTDPPKPAAAEPMSVALVLDVSLSMDPQWEPNQKAGKNPLGAMQRAALSILGAFETGDSLAIVSFAANAAVEFPMSRLDGAARTRAGKKLRELKTHEATNFEAGLRLGLQELLPAKGRRVALFLSDGTPNRGAHEGLLNDFKKAGIPVYTIGFEGEADWNRLQGIAEATGGKFAAADSANLLEILGRFQGQSHGLSEIFAGIALVRNKGDAVSVPFEVPQGLSRLRVSLSWSGDDEGLELTLRTPAGAAVTSATPGAEFDLEHAGTLRTVKFQYPESGTWSALVQANRIPAEGEMFRLSVRVDLPAPVEWVPFRSAIRPGEGVRLALETGGLKGYVWHVTVTPPGRAPMTVELVDNGVAIDEKAGDGVYGAEFSAAKVGIYEVTATGKPADGKGAEMQVKGAFVVGSEEEVLKQAR